MKGPDRKGVPNVPIEWRVTAGAGELLPSLHDVPMSVTNAEGFAAVAFRPTALGVITVTATTAALPGKVVIFNVSARRKPGIVIRIVPGFDCGDPSTFVGPNSSSDVTVSVGTVVEWVYPVGGIGGFTCTAHVRSLVAPPGGAPLDGLLAVNDYFQFAPDVPGTWDYIDAFNGGGGTLTARAP